MENATRRRQLSRLARNMRQGDRFTARDATVSPTRVATVEVVSVSRIADGFLTGTRRYRVGVRHVTGDNIPFLNSPPFVFHGDERVDITRAVR